MAEEMQTLPQNITLEALPGLFVEFYKKFESFRENHSTQQSEIEAPISVDEARDFLKLENTQTIYRLVQRNEIPFHKKNSRLYFFKSELKDYICSPVN